MFSFFSSIAFCLFADLTGLGVVKNCLLQQSSSDVKYENGKKQLKSIGQLWEISQIYSVEKMCIIIHICFNKEEKIIQLKVLKENKQDGAVIYTILFIEFPAFISKKQF